MISGGYTWFCAQNHFWRPGAPYGGLRIEPRFVKCKANVQYTELSF